MEMSKCRYHSKQKVHTPCIYVHTRVDELVVKRYTSQRTGSLEEGFAENKQTLANWFRKSDEGGEFKFI